MCIRPDPEAAASQNLAAAGRCSVLSFSEVHNRTFIRGSSVVLPETSQCSGAAETLPVRTTQGLIAKRGVG